jgi:cbb3-type cytochrome oxidase subunit 3
MQAIKNTYYLLLENVDYYGIFLLMFLAVFILILAIAFIIRGKQGEAEARLGKLVGKEAPSKTGNTSSRLLGHMMRA